MYTKEITYTDFDGQERKEKLQFNLTKAEWLELQFKTMSSNEVQAMLDRKDVARLVSFFKELILTSYGEKSADGRRFNKSPEIRADFESTQAFSDFFVYIASDPEAASEFLVHVVPSDMTQDAEKIVKEQLRNVGPTQVDVIEPR